jgi:hypothetical protein
VLNFALPLGRLSESQQVSGLRVSQVVFFEETAEEFLRIKMKFYNRSLSFSDFNVTVATQLLPREQLEPLSDELIHLRRLEESSLIIVADVIASASPADVAIQFPFQEIVYGVFVQYSDEFRGKLSSSEEFGVYSPIRGGGSTDKTVVLGGSLAGIGVLISLLVAFVMIRQRRHSPKHEDGTDCVTPTSVSSMIELGELHVPRIDDSSFPDNVHRKKPSTNTLLSKNVTASDEWSICDEDLMHGSNFTHHSLMTDSGESVAASSFELDKDVYQENDNGLQSAEELVMPSQTSNAYTGLFDRSEAENELNSSRELELFDSMTMPRYEINATDTPSDVGGNVYQVRAPSGPLGIVIEASKAGPIVRKV